MKKITIILFLSLFLFSCSINSPIIQTPRKKSVNTSEQSIPSIRKQVSPHETKGQIQTTNGSVGRVKIEYVPLPYSGKGPWTLEVKEKKVKQQVSIVQGLKISVEDMPLNEFVKLVFGKILKVSYFMGRNVESRKDKITLNMTQPLSKDEFLNVIASVLEKYGVKINEENGVYFVKVGGKEQRRWFIPFYIGRSLPPKLYGEEDKLVGLIVPVYYIHPNLYTGLIKNLALSSQGDITTTKRDNAFMVVDKPLYLRAALKFIKLFDRPLFSKRMAILIRLEYLTPSTFVKKLTELLPLEGIPIAKSLNSPGLILKPMDKQGYVFVLTPKRDWLKIIEFWKNKLDIISALGESPRMFVFYPKNRRAVDLASIITKLGTSFVAKTNKKAKNLNPAFNTGGNIKVAVDEGRNCLVILATPSQYKQIKSVLEKLDTLPKQVLVQITIAEVTLTKNLQYGIEWYLRHSGKYSGILSTMGTLGIGTGGINYSIVSDTGKFQGLINAFAKKNLINVLSSPRLVVLDNHEASITVGTQIPTLVSTSTNPTVSENGTSSLVNTIQYRKTGVILHIRPTINSNGILTMQISQEVSSPQTNNLSKIDSPIILDRNISTSVVLKSGATLLLGGLIKSQKSKTVNKVPVLGDIPILGNLFKTTSKSTIKTELIIEITPYILSNMSEAVQATQRFKALLKWLNNY